MKTFNRTSLPESITYNGKVYKVDIEASSAIMGKNWFSLDTLGLVNKNCICVNVLSKNLKGKTDLFGQPYKPTTWIFTA